MNKHQKKLRKLLDKEKFEEIADLIKRDARHEFNDRRHISGLFNDSVLMENRNKSKEVKELIDSLCTIAFFKEKLDVFQALESYRNFHFEDCINMDAISYFDFTITENHALIMMAIINKFDTLKNRRNRRLVLSIIKICNSITQYYDKNPDLNLSSQFFIESCVKFLNIAQILFFETTKDEKTHFDLFIKNIIDKEHEILQTKKHLSEQEELDSYRHKSILKNFYEHNEDFFILHTMFTENFSVFKIIIESMLENHKPEYIFNTYLTAKYDNGQSVFEKIKSMNTQSYIDFIQDTLFDVEKETKIHYQFSGDFSTLFLKIKNIQGYEHFRLNIQYIAYFSFKEENHNLILTADNKVITINHNLFSTIPDYELFKQNIEKFSSYQPENENIEILQLKNN